MLSLIPSPKPPPAQSNTPQPLRLRHLQQPSMLLRMRLLHIPLRHLLHHKVPLNLHLLAQPAIHNPPLSGNSQRANGGLGVDEGVDAVGDVGEGEFVGCLVGGGLVCMHECMCVCVCVCV